MAKELCEYFISNWDHYRANIFNSNMIKITPKNIKDVMKMKFPEYVRRREGRSKSIIVPWLTEFMKREFEERGFRVEKKIVKSGNHTKYTILYVYRQ